MLKVLYIAFSILLFTCSSCNKNESLQVNERRVEISFIGSMDKIEPWAKFHIYSQVPSDLYYIDKQDTTLLTNSLYNSTPNDFYRKHIKFTQRFSNTTPSLQMSFTYRKITSVISPSDSLRIQIRSLINHRIELDTTLYLSSFQKGEKISAEKYIHRITI